MIDGNEGQNGQPNKNLIIPPVPGYLPHPAANFTTFLRGFTVKQDGVVSERCQLSVISVASCIWEKPLDMAESL